MLAKNSPKENLAPLYVSVFKAKFIVDICIGCIIYISICVSNGNIFGHLKSTVSKPVRKLKNYRKIK